MIIKDRNSSCYFTHYVYVSATADSGFVLMVSMIVMVLSVCMVIAVTYDMIIILS